MANRLDSMLTEKQRLAMMADMMGNPDAENMNVLARTASIPAMPENYIQNSGTGAVTSLDEFAPNALMRQMQPALDYKSGPVEMGGMKGYRLAGDPFTVMMPDGSRLSLGNDMEAGMKRDKERLALESSRLGNQEKAVEIKTKNATLAGEISGQDWMKDFDGSGRLILVNRRTGEVRRPSEEIVGAKYSTGLAGDMAGAKTKGEALGKREVNMAGLGNTIQEADDLLKGATGKPLPTGSMFGTGVDAVSGVFGLSPDGAAEAQRLKAIGGALTSKMPRMEGPQSDKDVQLYREMAAVVGDSTVPRDRRIAALEEVKKIWAKYEKQAAPDAPPKGYDSAKEARYQAWLKAQGK